MRLLPTARANLQSARFVLGGSLCARRPKSLSVALRSGLNDSGVRRHVAQGVCHSIQFEKFSYPPSLFQEYVR
jgi:hypothetical protein